MTYESQETSQFSGEPVECYRFTVGGESWFYTSADREIVLPTGTFIPEVISHNEQELSQEDGSGSIDILVTRTNPIAALYIPFVPTSAPYISIYRAHRGSEEDPRVSFVGKITDVRFKGSEAILTCSPISQSTDRRFPALTYQTQCNWALYSTPCGIDKSAYRDEILITEIDGNDLVSNDFSLRPDGWFTAGWMERSNGDVRFVVAHTGDRVTLMNPFTDLASLETVGAYAGCDRTETACDTKFSNLVRHLGFSRIPSRNPHEGRFA